MLIQVGDLPVADTSIFPEIDLPPSLEHLRPNVEIKYLTFTGKKRDIYIDEKENSIRENDHSENTESIESLKNSFQGGIQTTCQLPCVTKSNRKQFDFELVFGYGRTNSLATLTSEYYFYTIPNLSSFERQTLQCYENRKLPKTDNKEVEVANYITRGIHSGNVLNTESAIRKAVKEVEPHKGKASIESIVNLVMQDNGIVNTFRKINEHHFENWVQDHSKEELHLGYDLITETYGWLVGEGYETRMIWKALRRWVEEGKTSNFILHHNKPGINSSFADKRKTRKEFLLKELAIAEKLLGRPWTDVISIKGFVPQDRESERNGTLSPKELIAF